MGRKIKLPKPRKIKRNPVARSLAVGAYRARVVPRVGTYRRRAKHAKLPEDEGP